MYGHTVVIIPVVIMGIVYVYTVVVVCKMHAKTYNRCYAHKGLLCKDYAKYKREVYTGNIDSSSLHPTYPH